MLLGVGLLAMNQPAAMAGDDDPVAALERNAQPLRTTEPDNDLRDLRPFGEMVGDAEVVNVGEATHSSREFVTMQQRIFHYLAEEKGFGTFAREMSWSTGLLLNEYIQNGKGNPREIMDRELETFYQVLDNAEFLELIESLRRYNAKHDDKVQIIGSDLAYPGPILFEKVDDYLAEHHPGLRSAFDALYQEMKPESGQHLGEYMKAYQERSLAHRKLLAVKARTARNLLRAVDPGKDSPHKKAYEWTLQHATAIAQTAEEYSFDTSTASGRAAAGAYRDKIMADNIEWWNEHTGDKTMVSNLTVHASYEPIDTAFAPKTVAQHLRERLGGDQVNAGFSFAEGGFNAMAPNGDYRGFSVKAGAGQNEHTLDKVRYDDYVLDLRTAPGPARRWLSSPRTTFNIGGDFDPEDSSAGRFDVALGKSYDILFHLDEVEETTLLFG